MFWRKSRQKIARLEEAISLLLKRTEPQTEEAPASLLTTLLELERTRLEKAGELDLRQAELKAKHMEIELAEIERVGVEKRKQMLFNEELKAKRRESAAHAREARAAKHEALIRERQAPLFGGGNQCEECLALVERRAPRHSGHLIAHANGKHREWLESNGHFEN